MSLSFLLDVNDSDSSSLLSKYKPFSPFDATNKAFNKFLCFAFFTAPNISSVIKNNRNQIFRTPIKQISIEVVFQVWRIEYPIRLFGKCPWPAD